MTALFDSPLLFPLALAALLLGAFGALILPASKASNLWGNAWALIGSLLALASGLSAMGAGDVTEYRILSGLPLFSASVLRIDTLSAFFVAVIGATAACTSVYGFGYGRHYFKQYSLGILHFFLNLFLVGMLLVVTAGDAVSFLVAWELMVLSSFFLVVYEHRQAENIQAGLLYFVMSHIGTAAILFAFLLLMRATGTLDFAGIAELSGSLPLWVKNLAFGLGLFGFGMKAGVIPLHIWLPGAHPAAPSNVSALMSGVMIKTGIYMIIRFAVDLLGLPELWWGVVILLAGAVSALLGALYALSEHDIKRLLAYSSIENIGIILLGVGMAVIFLAFGLPGLAVLALTAGLFHTVNHAVFKALLFLGAGAVVLKTHTRNMEEYGGLIKTMPVTAALFLAGSMAIAALPPFNGFFSEWLTFQGLFAGIGLGPVGVTVAFVVAAGALAFTGGLAAAVFVKAFGTSFLARPRSDHAASAREVSPSLLYGMGGLAVLALALGAGAGLVVRSLEAVATSLVGASEGIGTVTASPNALTVGNGFAYAAPLTTLLVLISALAVVAAIVLMLTARRTVTRDRTWDCGTDLSPRMEITPTAFSRSLILIFKSLLRPRQELSTEYGAEDLVYFQRRHRLHLDKADPYATYLYRPLASLLTNLADFVKKIQSGNLNVYLLYILLTLVILLFVLLSFAYSDSL